jgi:hypothetical protein
MGTLTLENFRSELLFDLKNRTDTSVPEGLTTTRQDLFINAGYLHVTHPSVFRHRELQHSYTLTLVNGTQSYLFHPNAGVNITALRYVAHVAAATDSPTAFRTKLFPKDEQWFQQRTLVSGGPPRDYFVRGDRIFLSPVPGANENGQVLVVGAWREPAVLTAGAVTVLSSLWDEVVLLAARWRAEFHLGYRDLAEATKLDFVSLLNEYRDFEQLHGEDWDWVSEVRTERVMESL